MLILWLSEQVLPLTFKEYWLYFVILFLFLFYSILCVALVPCKLRGLLAIEKLSVFASVLTVFGGDGGWILHFLNFWDSHV